MRGLSIFKCWWIAAQSNLKRNWFKWICYGNNMKAFTKKKWKDTRRTIANLQEVIRVSPSPITVKEGRHQKDLLRKWHTGRASKKLESTITTQYTLLRHCQMIIRRNWRRLKWTIHQMCHRLLRRYRKMIRSINIQCPKFLWKTTSPRFQLLLKSSERLNHIKRHILILARRCYKSLEWPTAQSKLTEVHHPMTTKPSNPWRRTTQFHR